MDPNEALDVFQQHINKSIDAKLVPMMGMITGLEVAIIHLFNCLHQRGVLSRDQAIQSLAATREGLPQEAGAIAPMVLKHIEMGLEALHPPQQAATPEDLRTTFRVLPGGLSDEPPEGTR